AAFPEAVVRARLGARRGRDLGGLAHSVLLDAPARRAALVRELRVRRDLSLGDLRLGLPRRAERVPHDAPPLARERDPGRARADLPRSPDARASRRLLALPHRRDRRDRSRVRGRARAPRPAERAYGLTSSASGARFGPDGEGGWTMPQARIFPFLW